MNMNSELRLMLKTQAVHVITVDGKGYPDVMLKRDAEVLDGGRILLPGVRSERARRNLKRSPAVTVLVTNPLVCRGYQVRGRADLLVHRQGYDMFYTDGAEVRMEKSYRNVWSVVVTVEDIAEVAADGEEVCRVPRQLPERGRCRETAGALL